MRQSPQREVKSLPPALIKKAGFKTYNYKRSQPRQRNCALTFPKLESKIRGNRNLTMVRCVSQLERDGIRGYSHRARVDLGAGSGPPIRAD